MARPKVLALIPYTLSRIPIHSTPWLREPEIIAEITRYRGNAHASETVLRYLRVSVTEMETSLSLSLSLFLPLFHFHLLVNDSCKKKLFVSIIFLLYNYCFALSIFRPRATTLNNKYMLHDILFNANNARFSEDENAFTLRF